MYLKTAGEIASYELDQPMVLSGASAFTPSIVSTDPDLTYSVWNAGFVNTATKDWFVLYLNSLSTNPIFSYDQLRFLFPAGTKLFGTSSTNTSSVFLFLQDFQL